MKVKLEIIHKTAFNLQKEIYNIKALVNTKNFNVSKKYRFWTWVTSRRNCIKIQRRNKSQIEVTIEARRHSVSDKNSPICVFLNKIEELTKQKKEDWRVLYIKSKSNTVWYKPSCLSTELNK